MNPDMFGQQLLAATQWLKPERTGLTGDILERKRNNRVRRLDGSPPSLPGSGIVHFSQRKASLGADGFPTPATLAANTRNWYRCPLFRWQTYT